MISFADTRCDDTIDSDEVTKYNAINMSQFGFKKQVAMDDPYFALRFWWNRRKGFPGLFKVAL